MTVAESDTIKPVTEKLVTNLENNQFIQAVTKIDLTHIQIIISNMLNIIYQGAPKIHSL